MTHLITVLAIICLTFSPGALSIWLYAGNGVGCIKVLGKPLCEPRPEAVGMPDAAFYDGKSGNANINIEFGFDANDAGRPPAYKQDFTFPIPNGVDDFVFTTEFCIAEKDNTGKKLACYHSEEVNFQSSSNPYITTGWKGVAPEPPSVKGGPQSRLGTYDANLEASNIFNDQETGSPGWFQTPDNNAKTIDRAFAFPNPYSIPEDPWG